MPSFNKVILMGNLTRDPEMKMLPSGNAICKLGIAVSRQFRDQSGEQREETAFVDVDAFGKQAEVIGKYFSKGRPILVEGRLKLDQWEDRQTGQKRSKLGVVIENFQFVGSKSDNDHSGSTQTTYPQTSRSVPAPTQDRTAAYDVNDDDDGEVPF